MRNRLLGLAAALVLVLTGLGAPGTVAPAGATEFLDVRLENVSATTFRITWEGVAWADHYLVRVANSRNIDALRRDYRVEQGEPTSLVVEHGPGVTPSSGAHTFVEIVAVRPDGRRSDTRSHWIMPPLQAPAAARTRTNSVHIATFNVRTWGVDANQRAATSWTHRRDRVAHHLAGSGADVFLVQEASGTPAQRVAGRRFQYQDLVRRLPARFRLAFPGLYKLNGRGRGSQGNRIIYDGSVYTRVSAGYYRIPAPNLTRLRWVPWVLLRSKVDPSVSFYAMSAHLYSGNDRPGSTTLWRIRQQQTDALLTRARRLAATGRTVFLGGDFNSTSNTLPWNNVHRTLVEAGFYDAFAAASRAHGAYPTTTNSFSFPVPPGPYRRDYLMSLGAPVGSYGYVNHVVQRRSQLVSDHFMQSAVMPVAR